MRAQAPDERLKKISEDWNKRRQRIQTVLYRVEGEGTAFKEALDAESMSSPGAKKSWPGNVTSWSKYTLLLDFEKQRHRLEQDSPSLNITTQQKSRIARTVTFDGKKLMGQRHQPEGEEKAPAKSAEDADLGVVEGAMVQVPFSDILWPLFVGHGIVGIAPANVLIPGKFNIAPNLEMVVVHGQGMHHGRSCVILRSHARKADSTEFEEFWVDVERDSALLRRLAYYNNTPTTDADIEYEKTEHGWMVKRWTDTTRAKYAGKILTTGILRMQVKELAINLPVSDNDFQIDVKPGMLVKRNVQTESTTKNPSGTIEQRLYRVESDGTWREVEFQDGVEKSRWAFSFWWALVLVPLIGMCIWWRRAFTKQTNVQR